MPKQLDVIVLKMSISLLVSLLISSCITDSINPLVECQGMPDYSYKFRHSSDGYHLVCYDGKKCLHTRSEDSAQVQNFIATHVDNSQQVALTAPGSESSTFVLAQGQLFHHNECYPLGYDNNAIIGRSIINASILILV